MNGRPQHAPAPRSGAEAALWRAVDVAAHHHPEAAPRLEAAVARLLRPVLEHPDPGAAWGYSRLNGNGAPLEFTFSTLDRALRYTVELGGPDMPSTQRLAEATAQLCALDPGATGDVRFAELARLQAGGELRWGAWLGLRHRPDRDHLKLYVEVPPGAAERAAAFLPPGLQDGLPLGPGRRARCAAVGLIPGTAQREAYFALSPGALTQAELATLLAPVGLAEGCGALWTLMREMLVGGASRSGLPEAEYGVSYAAGPDGGQPVVSVFSFAGELIGGDGVVRLQTLAMAARRGFDLGAYAAMTAPLARRFDRCDSHNVLAFVLGPGPVPGLHVSLSPPVPAEMTTTPASSARPELRAPRRARQRGKA